MTWSVFLITFLSAVCWSLFDASRKKVGEKLDPIQTLVVIMSYTAIPVLIWGLQTNSLSFNSSYLVWGTFGFLVNFWANYSFINSVKKGDLGEVIPILSLIPAITAVFSFFFLQEVLKQHQVLGIFVIYLGTGVLIGFLPKNWSRSHWWMIQAAIAWSLMGVFDKKCLEHATIQSHFLYQLLGICLIALIASKKLPRFLWNVSLFKSYAPWAALGVLSAIGAIVWQLEAIQVSYLGIFEGVKRGVSMLLSMLLGVFLFREKVSAKKLLALSIITTGLALLLTK